MHTYIEVSVLCIIFMIGNRVEVHGSWTQGSIVYADQSEKVVLNRSRIDLSHPLVQQEKRNAIGGPITLEFFV